MGTIRHKLLPIEKILGRNTLRAIRSFTEGSAAILQRPTKPPAQLLEYKCLTPWRPLDQSQLTALRNMLHDSTAYWVGDPIYRRLPPRAGFGLRLNGGSADVIVLIDLQNPGWEIFCEYESYWGFHFAEDRINALAKSLFPEYASAYPGSVWKRDAIKTLERSDLSTYGVLKVPRPRDKRI